MKKIISQSLAAMLSVCGSGLVWKQGATAEEIPIAPETNILSPAANIKQPVGNRGANCNLENLLASPPTKKASGMSQVTSVSQLSDVQPTDWAFGALQSLVERYGCIEGYPESASAPLRERTYRGNRAITRYEFAAGLNACLNRMQELIGTVTPSTPDITQTDLETLRRLQQEFAAELATLKGRVDALEMRTTTLERQQFSTTVKLRGTILTYLSDAFGENADDLNNTALQYRAILNFTTSFTGKDRLNVGLQTFNFRRFNPGAEFPEGRLGTFAGTAGATDEIRVVPLNFTNNNEIRLFGLQYSYQVKENLQLTLNAFSRERTVSERVTPFTNTSIGPVSYYGRINPMIYPIGGQTGLDVLWKPRPWLDLAFSAASEFGSPENPSTGLFNGGYFGSARSLISIGNLELITAYIHSYSPEQGFDTLSGSNAAKVRAILPATDGINISATSANTYVGGLFYQFSPKFQVGGSISYSNVRSLADGVRGSANVFDYRANLIFYDLGKKGNLAGLIFGIQPRLTGTSTEQLARAIGLPVGQRSDRDVGFHVEAFYTHRVNNNIAITPGVFWLTAPNHDDRNPDVIVGVLRTSFTF